MAEQLGMGQISSILTLCQSGRYTRQNSTATRQPHKVGATSNNPVVAGVEFGRS